MPTPDPIMPPAIFAAWVAICATQPIPDFELLDPAGAPVRLSVHVSNAPAVLVVRRTKGPLANRYAPRASGPRR